MTAPASRLIPLALTARPSSVHSNIWQTGTKDATAAVARRPGSACASPRRDQISSAGGSSKVASHTKISDMAAVWTGPGRSRIGDTPSRCASVNVAAKTTAASATETNSGQLAAAGNQSGYDKHRERWNVSTDRQPDHSARMRETGEAQHDEIGRDRPRGQHDRDTNSAVVPPGRVADRSRGQSADAERRDHRRVSAEVRETRHSCC